MMNVAVQQGCARDTMLDFEELKKLTEDRSRRQVREQGLIKDREIHPQENKRDPERSIRFVESPLSDRWSRRMKLDETYRVLTLFTLRF